MTVTVVLPDLPLPIRSGSHLRDWQQLRLLKALGHRVRLFAFLPSSRRPSEEQIRPIRELVGEMTTLPLKGEENGARGGNTKIARHLRTLWPWHPWQTARYGYLKEHYPFVWPFDASDGGERVRSYVHQGKPTTVLLRSLLLHYVPLLKPLGCRIVVDAHDLHARSVWQNARLEREVPKKILASFQALTLLRHEGRYLAQCDEIWTTSSWEAAIFRRLSRGNPHLVVLPNLVDLERYRPHSSAPSTLILMAGNLGIPMNAEGAHRLVSVIFPRVKRIVPEARLRLVGAALPPATQLKVQQMEGAQWLGHVPELQPHFEEAAVVAIPLKDVGGTPYKLMEALAFGKAVVTTSRTIVGISARPGEHLLVADTSARFADALVRLLRDPSQRMRLGQRARELAEREYSFSVGERILRTDSRHLSPLAQERRCAS